MLTYSNRGYTPESIAKLFQMVFAEWGNLFNTSAIHASSPNRFDVDRLGDLVAEGLLVYQSIADVIGTPDVPGVPDEHRLSACQVVSIIELNGFLFYSEIAGVRGELSKETERDLRVLFARDVFIMNIPVKVAEIPVDQIISVAIMQVLKNAFNKETPKICAFSLSFQAYLMEVIILLWRIVRQADPHLVSPIGGRHEALKLFSDNFLRAVETRAPQKEDESD